MAYDNEYLDFLCSRLQELPEYFADLLNRYEDELPPSFQRLMLALIGDFELNADELITGYKVFDVCRKPEVEIA